LARNGFGCSIVFIGKNYNGMTWKADSGCEWRRNDRGSVKVANGRGPGTAGTETVDDRGVVLFGVVPAPAGTRRLWWRNSDACFRRRNQRNSTSSSRQPSDEKGFTEAMKKGFAAPT
jgi:hypothetical protein